MYKAQQARLHLDKIKSLFEIIICKPNSDEPLCMTLMLSDYFIGHLLLFIMKYDACWSYIHLSDILQIVFAFHFLNEFCFVFVNYVFEYFPDAFFQLLGVLLFYHNVNGIFCQSGFVDGLVQLAVGEFLQEVVETGGNQGGEAG
jgi:hypothetical protein